MLPSCSYFILNSNWSFTTIDYSFSSSVYYLWAVPTQRFEWGLLYLQNILPRKKSRTKQRTTCPWDNMRIFNAMVSHCLLPYAIDHFWFVHLYGQFPIPWERGYLLLSTLQREFWHLIEVDSLSQEIHGHQNIVNRNRSHSIVWGWYLEKETYPTWLNKDKKNQDFCNIPN